MKKIIVLLIAVSLLPTILQGSYRPSTSTSTSSTSSTQENDLVQHFKNALIDDKTQDVIEIAGRLIDMSPSYISHLNDIVNKFQHEHKGFYLAPVKIREYLNRRAEEIKEISARAELPRQHESPLTTPQTLGEFNKILYQALHKNVYVEDLAAIIHDFLQKYEGNIEKIRNALLTIDQVINLAPQNNKALAALIAIRALYPPTLPVREKKTAKTARPLPTPQPKAQSKTPPPLPPRTTAQPRSHRPLPARPATHARTHAPVSFDELARAAAGNAPSIIERRGHTQATETVEEMRREIDNQLAALRENPELRQRLQMQARRLGVLIGEEEEGPEEPWSDTE